MGDFVIPTVEIGSSFWDTVVNLKENLNSLEVAMERLKPVYEDVKERVESEEQLLRTRKRTNEVAGWLYRVQLREAEVIVILQEGKEREQKKYGIKSKYKVGKRVSKMLNEVNELSTEGCFNVVAMDAVCATVNEKPMEKTVGLELMVEKVWRCIEDTDLQTIGLYGLGGVGKTTLLKQINNEFLNSDHEFEAVIWVSVSQQPDLKKMQDEILRELIPNERRLRYMSKESKADTMYGILKEKKFVLLLDDIWERLDLAGLGVPIQDMQKGSKVVFTTRSLEICGLMEAQRKIKVECLTPEVALDLFRMKVGEDTLNSHPLISSLAETMAAECKGLPLALVTIGRSMATRKNPEEWEQEISILRNSPSQFPGGTLLLNSINENTSSMMSPRVIVKRAFTHSEVVSITSDFENFIGEGGFGKVFLGTLDGTQVAVKRWSISSRQGYKEFEAEQAHMMVLHKNLVSLIGYCDEGDNKALVYEYMANGNLRKVLSEESTKILTWEERLKIALDVARGLEYLHDGCKVPIVHRDMKTSNILLNENWEAKLSDFGLSRLLSTENASHVSTDAKGTNGYLDPEYNVTKKLKKPSDVYSFGVVLLELVTSRPVIIAEPNSLPIHIFQWVSPLYRKRDIGSIVDPRLRGTYNSSSAENVIETSINCLKFPATQRPEISEVCDELKKSKKLQTDAKISQRR